MMKDCMNCKFTDDDETDPSTPCFTCLDAKDGTAPTNWKPIDCSPVEPHVCTCKETNGYIIYVDAAPYMTSLVSLTTDQVSAIEWFFKSYSMDAYHIVPVPKEEKP